jgi:hypothetical protein
MASAQVVAGDPRTVHQCAPLCIACVFQLPSLRLFLAPVLVLGPVFFYLGGLVEFDQPYPILFKCSTVYTLALLRRQQP